MKLPLTLCLTFLLTACFSDDTHTRVDQCKRIELFQQCLAAIPKGPEKTVYNDWSEVVESCDDISHRQSFKLKKQIPVGCLERD